MSSVIKLKCNDDVERLLRFGALRRIAARENLFLSGDKSSSMFYITEGTVCTTLEDTEGGETMILDYHYSRELVGTGEFFGGSNSVRRTSAFARTYVEAIEIPASRALQICQEEPRLFMLIGSSINAQLSNATSRTADLAFNDIPARTLRILRELAKHPTAMSHPRGMQIRITRTEIGSIICACREMVGRVLKQLEADGLITARGKTIVVHHEHRLAAAG